MGKVMVYVMVKVMVKVMGQVMGTVMHSMFSSEDVFTYRVYSLIGCINLRPSKLNFSLYFTLPLRKEPADEKSYIIMCACVRACVRARARVRACVRARASTSFGSGRHLAVRGPCAQPVAISNSTSYSTFRPQSFAQTTS